MSWTYELSANNGYSYQVAANNDYSYALAVVAPVQIDSAEVQNALVITVTLNTIMNYTFEVVGETPTTDNFTLSKNGAPLNISTFLVNKTYENYKLQISLDGYVLAGDTVTFTYNGDTWKTKDGQYVPHTNDYAITNDLE